MRLSFGFTREIDLIKAHWHCRYRHNWNCLNSLWKSIHQQLVEVRLTGHRSNAHSSKRNWNTIPFRTKFCVCFQTFRFGFRGEMETQGRARRPCITVILQTGFLWDNHCRQQLRYCGDSRKSECSYSSRICFNSHCQKHCINGNCLIVFGFLFAISAAVGIVGNDIKSEYTRYYSFFSVAIRIGLDLLKGALF